MSLLRYRSTYHRATALLGVALGGSLFASIASALSVETTLTCPGPTTPGQTVPIHVRIENSECPPVSVTVRLSSMLTGNLNQTVGNAAIVGPKVAASSIAVPAGACTFPFTPGVYDNNLQAPPVVPAAFSEKVAALVLVTESSDGANTGAETDSCILTVPEPTLHAQLCAGVLALLILSRLGAHGVRSRPEKRA